MVNEDDKDPALMAHRIEQLELRVGRIEDRAGKVLLAIVMAAFALIWEPIKSIVLGRP